MPQLIRYEPTDVVALNEGTGYIAPYTSFDDDVLEDIPLDSSYTPTLVDIIPYGVTGGESSFNPLVTVEGVKINERSGKIKQHITDEEVFFDFSILSLFHDDLADKLPGFFVHTNGTRSKRYGWNRRLTSDYGFVWVGEDADGLIVIAVPRVFFSSPVKVMLNRGGVTQFPLKVEGQPNDKWPWQMYRVL